MSLWDALRMNMMISYQELVRTFPNNQAKATFDLAKNLADGKDAAAGTNWKIDNKIVRVPYVGVDKDNLSQFTGK